jgi:hypothetical protein
MKQHDPIPAPRRIAAPAVRAPASDLAATAGVRPPLALAAQAVTLLVAALLCGCSGSDATTVAGNVPVAYAKRVNTISLNPLTGASSAPGGDIIIRDTSSASAPEHNITASITQGVGDVADPEVSYDGTKLVFAMNCPSSNTSTINGVKACTGRWNIWEYDMSAGIASGTFRRITNSTTADDVGPAYLPNGRGFVFSSNRQATSSLNQALGHSYIALDEYERETVFNLHTMDINGGSITQISFNQSHDRNPVVRPNGDIMFSRWEHVADRNRFSIFTVKPDGTNMFVLYGAHADGNSFLHPRDMDPSGKYAGFLASDLMPLDRTHAGGALMFIDAANYSDQNFPANNTVPATGGQTSVTAQPLNYGMGISMYGRVTTPYPLWDGTNRVLVSYTPCEVTRYGVVVPCSTLTAAEVTRLTNTNRLNTDVATDYLQDNVPPSYAVYMFDPASQTWLAVATPPAGFMYTDPIPLQARTEPSTAQPTSVDPTLKGQNLAQIEVVSAYDTDAFGRMGAPVIAAADLPTGCTTAIATTAPADPLDNRPQVADLVKIKDPANKAYGCTPVRFVRAVRAVAPPSNSIGERHAIGNTNFEQTQILGYAVVEPDGSFKLNIPADTPVGFSIVDANGQAFQVHTNWIQARPGEKRTCDGCHSPRRGAAINTGTVVNTVPSSWVSSLASQHQPGETMAGTRTRLTPSLLNLVADPVYTDVWADTTKPNVTARAPISLLYTGNGGGQDLTTAVPQNGIINYPDHIQPLWDTTAGRPGGASCSSCHTAADTLLDLTNSIAGTGRMTSYESLTLGPPLLNSSGQPVLQIEDGVQVVERSPALVQTMASESEVIGLARRSRLAEILFGRVMMSTPAEQALYPTPTGVDHSQMLNKAEKRLLAEWIDLGGKYYNDPFNGSAGVRTVATLNQATFAATIYPIIMDHTDANGTVVKGLCADGCHIARGSNTTAPPGTSFVENKFVLTGNLEGDFNNTLSMISDVCNPASNYLLSQPSTTPHPVGAVIPGTTTPLPAVLPVGSANYNTIANWIRSGC